MKESIVALLWAASLFGSYYLGFCKGKRYMNKFWYMAVALVALCSTAEASHVCVQKQVVHQQYAYAAPIVLQQVQPYYYYSVGSAVQEEAIAERISRLVTAKVAAKLKLSEAAPPEKPLGATVLTNKCAKCHTAGTKAVVDSEAPVFFDAQGNWIGTPVQAAQALTAARLGAMPPAPAEPLDDDSYLALKSFLSPK